MGIQRVYLVIDWPDRTVGLGPDRTRLILVRSSPKVKDRTVKQSPFFGPDRTETFVAQAFINKLG